MSEITKPDAEEFSQTLEQIGEGWFRQLALGIKLGVPEALGLTRRQWSDRIGVTVRSAAERRGVSVELSAEGLSNRAIADVLGVDHKTVDADLRGENSPRGVTPPKGNRPGSGENSPLAYSYINLDNPAVNALPEDGKRELDAAVNELLWVQSFAEWSLEHNKTESMETWLSILEIGKRHRKVSATFIRLLPQNARLAEIGASVEKHCAEAVANYRAFVREARP